MKPPMEIDESWAADLVKVIDWLTSEPFDEDVQLSPEYADGAKRFVAFMLRHKAPAPKFCVHGGDAAVFRWGHPGAGVSIIIDGDTADLQISRIGVPGCPQFEDTSLRWTDEAEGLALLDVVRSVVGLN